MRVCHTRIAFLAGFFVTACGQADSPDTSSSTARDSAGIVIVENPSLVEAPDLTWTLAASPSLEIGAVGGPEEYQLFRVSDAIRLTDGRLAVVNAGSSEVRVFAADGSYLESWGGEGEGPGEFVQPMTIVRWPPDSVAVWDWRQRRLTVLGQDGTVGRGFTLPVGDEMAFPVFSHVLESGRSVMSTQGFPDGPPEGGLQRNKMMVAVLSSEGEVATELGQYAGDEVFTHVGDGTVDVLLLPFSRRSLVAPAGEEILIGDNERFELRYLTQDGSLARIVRVDEPLHLVTGADLQIELEKQLLDAPEGMRAGIRRSFAATPMPDSLPAFAQLILDELGYHWMRIYRAPTDTGPERWAVLDAQGVLYGNVETPEGLDVYEIGADYVLGRATDELDVEHVQMWPLSR